MQPVSCIGDLKPANIMVTDDGQVKVLDFGLAKLTEATTGAEDATLTVRDRTEAGAIVGTMSYMSPEQAEGKPVDARSDIFSFGAVLYEMLTGQRAFQGDSRASTLAALLTQEPKPLSQTGSDVPQEFEKLIARCLRKDRERRLQHASDLKVALLDLKEESDSGTLGAAPARGRQTARRTTSRSRRRSSPARPRRSRAAGRRRSVLRRCRTRRRPPRRRRSRRRARARPPPHSPRRSHAPPATATARSAAGGCSAPRAARRASSARVSVRRCCATPPTCRR